MILRQKLECPVNGYWDGGKKDTFDWSINHFFSGKDSKGNFVRVGSYEANYWFYVSLGKTDKLTLANAKRKLKAITKIPCTFEYIE